MSLFDTIRYPVDENFRREDIERLPLELIADWCRYDIGMMSATSSAAALGFLMYSTEDQQRDALLKLRKRILEL